jgi:hypothetical protein
MRHDWIVTNNVATQELVRHNAETVAKFRAVAAEYDKASALAIEQAEKLEALNRHLSLFAGEHFLFGEDTANTKVASDPIPDSVANDPEEAKGTTIDDGAPIPAFLARAKA